MDAVRKGRLFISPCLSALFLRKSTRCFLLAFQTFSFSKSLHLKDYYLLPSPCWIFFFRDKMVSRTSLFPFNPRTDIARNCVVSWVTDELDVDSVIRTRSWTLFLLLSQKYHCVLMCISVSTRYSDIVLLLGNREVLMIEIFRVSRGTEVLQIHGMSFL